jgi:hypothetical protein
MYNVSVATLKAQISPNNLQRISSYRIETSKVIPRHTHGRESTDILNNNAGCEFCHHCGSKHYIALLKSEREFVFCFKVLARYFIQVGTDYLVQVIPSLDAARCIQFVVQWLEMLNTATRLGKALFQVWPLSQPPLPPSLPPPTPHTRA